MTVLPSALRQILLAVLLGAVPLIAPVPCGRRADAAFTQFIASLWLDAQKEGITRGTFDDATRGLGAGLQAAGSAAAGRPATGAPSQAEFVQVPADYLKEVSIARLAAEGQRLMIQQRATLAAIEQRFGVPGAIILAIWGPRDRLRPLRVAL